MTEHDTAARAGESLVDYLRTNRDLYTREALTDLLVSSGHSPEAVAAAWVEADADRSGAAEGAARDAPPPRLRQGFLGLLAALLAVATFVAGMFGIFAASAGRSAMLLYAILFPIQVILVGRWIDGRIRRSSGLRAGDAVVTIGWLLVPPVAMAALLGVCIAYTSKYGCVISC
jgi:hypothetical protein